MIAYNDNTQNQLINRSYTECGRNMPYTYVLTLICGTYDIIALIYKVISMSEVNQMKHFHDILFTSN